MKTGGMSDAATAAVAIGLAVFGLFAVLGLYRVFRRRFLASRSSSAALFGRRSSSGFTEFGSSTKRCHLVAGDESDDEGFEGETGSGSDAAWGDDARRRLDGILADAQWANDAAGLVPLCIDLLRSTQGLLEYLMELARERAPGKNWKLIVETADDINPLVDAVVQSMYPPLDSRVLVARATELVVSARNLADLVLGGPLAKAPLPDGGPADGGFVAESSSSALTVPGILRRRHRQVAKLVAGTERCLQALRCAVPVRTSRGEQEAAV